MSDLFIIILHIAKKCIGDKNQERIISDFTSISKTNTKQL